MALYGPRAIRYINLMVVFYFNKVFQKAILRNGEKNVPDCEAPAAEPTTNCDALCRESNDGSFIWNYPDIQETNDNIMAVLKNQLCQNEVMSELMVSTSTNNWPPLPKMCCIRSWTYQNIEFDIPIEFQKLIYFLYYLWMFHGMVNFINLVGGIIVMDKTVIIFGIFYNIFCLFYSFVGWYRCAYQAFSTRSAYYFLAFLYTFFLQFLMILIQSLGVPNSGTLGFMTALNAVPQMENLHVMVGVIVACACCSVAVLDFIAIVMVSNLHPQIVAHFVKSVNEKPRMKTLYTE